MKMTLHHFLRDDRGASAAEFALIVTVFVVFIFGIIDFGRVLWELNAVTTANQKGARYAVVNTYAAEEFNNIDGIALGYGSGVAIPVTDSDGNPVVPSTECDASGCTNGYTLNAGAYDAIVDAMRPWYAGIDSDAVRVVVAYEHIGLGFSGNPFGSDVVPLVTVRLEGAEFNFITPFVAALNPITLPASATSLTGEDGS
jgi:Flp pilus assembly pilin Flp